jgi:hypothetical protein
MRRLDHLLPSKAKTKEFPVSIYQNVCGGYGIPGPPGPPGTPLAATGAALYLTTPSTGITTGVPVVLSPMAVEYEYGVVDTETSPLAVVLSLPGLYLIEASVVWTEDGGEVPEGTSRTLTVSIAGDVEAVRTRSSGASTTTQSLTKVFELTSPGAVGMMSVSHMSAETLAVAEARFSVTMLGEIEGPS